jgi:hypothetical protein
LNGVTIKIFLWILRAIGLIGLREFAQSIRRNFLEISGHFKGDVQRDGCVVCFQEGEGTSRRVPVHRLAKEPNNEVADPRNGTSYPDNCDRHVAS